VRAVSAPLRDVAVSKEELGKFLMFEKNGAYRLCVSVFETRDGDIHAVITTGMASTPPEKPFYALRRRRYGVDAGSGNWTDLGPLHAPPPLSGSRWGNLAVLWVPDPGVYLVLTEAKADYFFVVYITVDFQSYIRLPQCNRPGHRQWYKNIPLNESFDAWDDFFVYGASDTCMTLFFGEGDAGSRHPHSDPSVEKPLRLPIYLGTRTCIPKNVNMRSFGSRGVGIYHLAGFYEAVDAALAKNFSWPPDAESTRERAAVVPVFAETAPGFAPTAGAAPVPEPDQVPCQRKEWSPSEYQNCTFADYVDVLGDLCVSARKLSWFSVDDCVAECGKAPNVPPRAYAGVPRRGRRRRQAPPAPTPDPRCVGALGEVDLQNVAYLSCVQDSMNLYATGNITQCLGPFLPDELRGCAATGGALEKLYNCSYNCRREMYSIRVGAASTLASQPPRLLCGPPATRTAGGFLGVMSEFSHRNKIFLLPSHDGVHYPPEALSYGGNPVVTVAQHLSTSEPIHTATELHLVFSGSDGLERLRWPHGLLFSLAPAIAPRGIPTPTSFITAPFPINAAFSLELAAVRTARALAPWVIVRVRVLQRGRVDEVECAKRFDVDKGWRGRMTLDFGEACGEDVARKIRGEVGEAVVEGLWVEFFVYSST